MVREELLLGISLLSLLGTSLSVEASDSTPITLKQIGRYSAGVSADPHAPQFVTYTNTSPTDISPEGLLFNNPQDSPNWKPLLVVSHEVSNTVTIFEIERSGQHDLAVSKEGVED